MFMSIGRQHARELRSIQQGLSLIAHADFDLAHAKCRTFDGALVDLD
jgi:hypothetical protein